MDRPLPMKPLPDAEAGGLEQLRRQYPRWRLWYGHTTGGYWALPPSGHPTLHKLIGATRLDELAQRLAQAEQPHHP
jgi:hypothetical protein